MQDNILICWANAANTWLQITMSLCCDPLFLICETVEWSQIHLQEFQSGETPLTSGTKQSVISHWSFQDKFSYQCWFHCYFGTCYCNHITFVCNAVLIQQVPDRWIETQMTEHEYYLLRVKIVTAKHDSEALHASGQSAHLHNQRPPEPKRCSQRAWFSTVTCLLVPTAQSLSPQPVSVGCWMEICMDTWADEKFNVILLTSQTMLWNNKKVKLLSFI